MNQLAAAFGAESSFIEPELLKAGEATVTSASSRPSRGSKVYSFYLADVFRRAPHTLTDAEEKLLADAGPLAGNPSSLFNILSNADFPYPTVTLSDGKSVKLDQAAFGELRALPNRADREKVMSAFFSALGSFGRTFGTSMSGEVQKVQFFAKARKYPSALASQLDGPNIPASVYTRLVDGVNRNLPAFHRYLKLRKRMMKLDQLHYYDLYAPLVASVDLKYTPGEAQKLVLAAVAPLGTDYQATIGRAFDSRWIDLYPNDGKASGAYSDGGAYDVHPYMLINYNGQYTDVSTLAHELGHTMQSYFSNKTQPYPLAGYPIFVAEVASTFNESLLIDYMLGQIKDDDTRLSLLGNYLENIKGTVFRQTQFAEFELRMHEMAEKGEPITGDALVEAVPGHHQEVLRPRPGRLRRRRLHRARVELHPALLPRLLRLPVRDVVHRLVGARREGEGGRSGGEEALPRVPVGRRLEVPGRSAEGRRRRHDDRRAARSHDQADEPDHGRDGDDPGEEAKQRRRNRGVADRREYFSATPRALRFLIVSA